MEAIHGQIHNCPSRQLHQLPAYSVLSSRMPSYCAYSTIFTHLWEREISLTNLPSSAAVLMTCSKNMRTAISIFVVMAILTLTIRKDQDYLQPSSPITSLRRSGFGTKLITIFSGEELLTPTLMSSCTPCPHQMKQFQEYFANMIIQTWNPITMPYCLLSPSKSLRSSLQKTTS